MNMTWRNPPAHHWYAAKSPGLFLSCKRDAGLFKRPWHALEAVTCVPDTEKYFGPEMGNRVATWLTYMSDVNGGGATVFPRLNITVWPKKVRS
ncbi:UNVERIFIED_CONTAM: Prolyl 4-hydroxylase subunit alpha-1 [Trichonephila clavipes]